MGGTRRGSRHGRDRGGFGEFREPSPYASDPPAKAARTVRERPAAAEAAAPQPAEARELAALRAERDALRERFDRLERMLADPDKGENAILYYRLRTVWNLCHKDLQSLVGESRRKFEVTEIAGAKVLSEPETDERAEVAECLQNARTEAERLQAQIGRMRYDLYEREKPFRTGEKRALERALDEATPKLVHTEARVRELATRLALLEAEAPPVRARAPARGTTTARRAVNTLLIALAQHYYLLFREAQIAEMALQAARKPVDAVYFGLAGECLEFNRKTRELMARARSERGRPEAVRRRSRYLHSRLRYDDDTTAVPRTDSLTWLPTRVGDDSDLVSEADELLPVNVLAQNYWDVAELLLE